MSNSSGLRFQALATCQTFGAGVLLGPVRIFQGWQTLLKVMETSYKLCKDKSAKLSSVF